MDFIWGKEKDRGSIRTGGEMKDYSVLDNMIRMVGDTIKQAFDKGYKQGYKDGYNQHGEDFIADGEKAYQRGLDDAWDAAKWIFNASVDDMMQTFGGVSLWVHYSASEAIARINEYEEKQTDDEIRVGDEVIVNTIIDRNPGIITKIDRIAVFVLFSNGETATFNISDKDIRKTGRHFGQIEEVLKQMQEDRE